MLLLRRLLLVVLCGRELPFAQGERRRTTPHEQRSGAGAIAEEAAALFLALRGYRILCRNRVNSVGELDIVARKGSQAVFVEVRSRSPRSPVAVADTLTRGKRIRIVRAAEVFARQHGLSGMDQRVDAVLVTIEDGGRVGAIEHMEDCVGAGGDA